MLPTIQTSDGKRHFDCVPAALLAFIMDEQERLLLLSHPNSLGRWEVINGAFEHGETLLEGTLREIREEAGDQLQVRPLGLIHAYTFPFDVAVPHLLSLCYLFAYEGGDVIPGGDMANSRVHWASVDEITQGDVTILVPRYMPWLFERAVELYRQLKDRPAVIHQPHFDAPPTRKYRK